MMELQVGPLNQSNWQTDYPNRFERRCYRNRVLVAPAEGLLFEAVPLALLA
jgi:hypothetical protein